MASKTAVVPNTIIAVANMELWVMALILQRSSIPYGAYPVLIDLTWATSTWKPFVWPFQITGPGGIA